MSNPGPATTTQQPSQNLNTQQAIRLLTSKKAVNMAATGDTALPILNATSYSITNIILANASVGLSGGTAAILTAPASAGTTIMASITISANTSAGIVTGMTVNTTNIQTVQNLYWRVTTATTATPATADVYIYGYDLS